jgi:hypothetical protein
MWALGYILGGCNNLSRFGSSWALLSRPDHGSGRVGLGLDRFGFFIIIFGLGRVESSFFLIRVKLLARAQPVAWSGWVFSGELGQVYRSGGP